MIGEPSHAGALGRDKLLGLLATSIILALFLAAPGTLLDKVDRAAYAVCHRIGERSFTIAGRQLPLCARCSGMYLGTFAGLVVLVARGRGRAGRFPKRRYWLALAVFVLVWAFDGVNSYLTLLPGLPHLYEPSNLLRLVTGTLQGLVVAAVILPVANLSFWRDVDPAPSVACDADLLWLLAGALAVIVVVNSVWSPLLYPLALLSGAMVVILVGAINTFGLLLAWHREGRAGSWSELLAPLLAGTALAVIELGAIGIARAALTESLGLPF